METQDQLNKCIQDMKQNQRALTEHMRHLLTLKKPFTDLLMRAPHDATARDQLAQLNQAMKGKMGWMVKQLLDHQAQLYQQAQNVQQTPNAPQPPSHLKSNSALVADTPTNQQLPKPKTGTRLKREFI